MNVVLGQNIIYGVVQIARETTFSTKGLRFKAFPVDQILWIEHCDDGKVMLAIYVDYCLVIGTGIYIGEITNSLKNYEFGLNIDKEKQATFVMQSQLINERFERKFGEDVENSMSNFDAPKHHSLWLSA